MTKNLSIFCDFDGTITTQDVVDAFLERFADAKWLAIEKSWHDGTITARECIQQQIACVPPLSLSAIEAFLKDIAIDPHFLELYAWARARQIPFCIVSDGFDFFIHTILRNHGVKGVMAFANRLKWSPERLTVEALTAARDCRVGGGVCKCTIVDQLAKKRRSIYIGDGRSDFCVAATANVIFAKDKLKAFCEQQRKPHTGFQNLSEVVLALNQQPQLTESSL